MNKLIFNARLFNTGRRIKSISGRFGLFIFRTYKDGKIAAYYKPRKIDSISDRSRTNFGSLSNQLREIADNLALTIVSINYCELA